MILDKGRNMLIMYNKIGNTLMLIFVTGQVMIAISGLLYHMNIKDIAQSIVSFYGVWVGFILMTVKTKCITLKTR